MRLLVFAHRGEANTFLSRLDMKAKTAGSQTIYQKENTALVITGEGIQNATLAVSSILSLLGSEITEILNFGICGKLKDTITNSIHEVRTVYAHDSNEPVFKSFELSKSGFDCISSFKRILSDDSRDKLSPFADLVDMELWGIASAAKFHKIPLRSFKLISDSADDHTQCQTIKEKAAEYSNQLFEYYVDMNDDQTLPTNTIEAPDGFHFTFTQMKQYEKLISKLTKKYSLSESDLLSDIEIDHIRYLEITPKEKTKFLLVKLEKMLNPFMGQVLEELKKETKLLEDLEAKFHFSPNFEKDEFELSLPIKSKKQFELIKSSLSSLDLEQIYKIIRGQSDV